MRLQVPCNCCVILYHSAQQLIMGGKKKDLGESDIVNSYFNGHIEHFWATHYFSQFKIIILHLANF